MVASEQTEPGEGWSYSGFLKPLVANPAMTAAQLAPYIVASYAQYNDHEYVQDYTLSAVKLANMDLLKANIDQFLTCYADCKKYGASKIKLAINVARRKALTFEMDDYVDLYSFYSALVAEIQKKYPKSAVILYTDPKAGPKPKPAPKPTAKDTDYDKAIAKLKLTILDGMQKISAQSSQMLSATYYPAQEEYQSTSQEKQFMPLILKHYLLKTLVG